MSRKHRNKHKTPRPPISPRKQPTLVGKVTFDRPATRDQPHIAPPFTFPRPETNTQVALTVAYDFDPADHRAKVENKANGSPGIYDVYVVLSVPGQGYVTDNLDPITFHEGGRSSLYMPTEYESLLAQVPRPDTSPIKVSFYHDGEGMINHARIRVDADGFDAAEQFAYDVVMPILSMWSFESDVALDIAGYKITEELTESFRLVMKVAGKTKVFSPPQSPSTPEFRILLSCYREAMNATNAFSQFLAFYRVIEGLYSLRAVRRDRIIALGEAYLDPPNERVPPSLPELGFPEDSDEEYFTPYLSKKFTAIRDEHRSVLRNAVAHGDPTGVLGDPLVMDRFDDVRRCSLAIPVTKYMARVMFHNEMQASLPQAESGSAQPDP